MTDVDDNMVCDTCRNTLGWHKEHHPRHMFNNAANGAIGINPFGKKPQPQPQPSVPYDPILRQALVDKGIITPDDLLNAQRKIMAIMGQLEQSRSAPKEEEWSRQERLLLNTVDDPA